jgi:hypothetical protein
MSELQKPRIDTESLRNAEVDRDSKAGRILRHNPLSWANKHRKLSAFAVTGLVGLVVGGATEHQIDKLNARGAKIGEYRADASKSIHQQRLHGARCLNGVVELRVGANIRQYPDAINSTGGYNVIGSIPLVKDIPLVQDLRGDKSSLNSGQVAYIYKPIVEQRGDSSWYEYYKTKYIEFDDGKIYSSFELSSDAQLANQMRFIDESGIASENPSAISIEYYSKNDADRTVECRINPTATSIMTNNGQPAAFGFIADHAPSEQLVNILR